MLFRSESNGNFSVRSLYKILNFRGIAPKNALLWWTVPIPLKIRIFMWLTHKNKILTTDNLHKKGWTGPTKCQFCPQDESIQHLFVTCTFTKKIWFYMGSCQEDSIQWNRFADIVNFAHQLPHAHRHGFLVVFSAVCWTLWKHRNELCFAEGKQKTTRQIIFLIKSLVLYWTGKMKQQVADSTALWFPSDMDVLPLAIWNPEDAEDSTNMGRLGAQIVPYGE